MRQAPRVVRICQAELAGRGVPRIEKSKEKGVKQDRINVWRTASGPVYGKHKVCGKKEVSGRLEGRRAEQGRWGGPGESALDLADKRRKGCCCCFEFLIPKIVYIQIKSIWETNKIR